LPVVFAPLVVALALLSNPVLAKESPSVVVQQGKASIYADKFQGRRTASGELHDQNDLTAASRILPLGTRAMVTNLETGKTVTVEITDRGPYVGGRVVDLSRRAAHEIGLTPRQGIARVRVEAHAQRQPTPDLKDEVARLATVRAAPPKRVDTRTAVRQPNLQKGYRERYGRQ
jgi:rare lipoprotein A